MKVYGLQFDIAWEDKAANFTTVRRLLVQTRPDAGSLIVLPEMFATGFSMNANAIAEATDGPTFDFLATVARHFACYLLGGIPTRHDNGTFQNESVLFTPDGTLLGRYAKIYPFTPGGEADHYTAGGHPVLLDIPTRDDGDAFRLAPFICYDLRFPEVFRQAVAGGATLYTVMASWPQARTHHWVALLQARAIENQAYVIGVNRCGTDPFFRYTGQSRILAPDGMILAEAGAEECVITATLDPQTVAAYRQQLPFLKDMRLDIA